MNAIVQALIPPPKYDVTKLVPGAQLCTEARLAGLFVIERATDDVTRTLADDEAIETLMENCDDAYGFPPYPLIAQFLYTRRGVDLRDAERGAVCSALAGSPATLLRSTSMDWWQRVPELMGIDARGARIARAASQVPSARTYRGGERGAGCVAGARPSRRAGGAALAGARTNDLRDAGRRPRASGTGVRAWPRA